MKTAQGWFEAGLAALERSHGADHSGEYEADLEEAVDAFEQALGLDRAHFGALRQRGFVLAQLDRHEEALDSFVAAASQQPEDADLQLAAAQSLAKLRHFDRALTTFEAVCRLRPGDVDVLTGRAEALTALERNERALEAWNELIPILETRRVEHHGKMIRDLTDDWRAGKAREARAMVLARLSSSKR